MPNIRKISERFNDAERSVVKEMLENDELPESLALQDVRDSVDTLIDRANSGGDTGPAGADGRDGVNGRDGAQGLQGLQGPQGETGPQGPTGNDGATGPQGPAGSDAPSPTFAQFSTTDTTSSINGNGNTTHTIPFNTTDIISSDGDFTLDDRAYSIIINDTGIYEIYFGLVLYGRVVRANPKISLYVNNVEQDIFGGTYIRNASGHNTNISHGTGLLSLSAEDVITLKSVRHSDWGSTGDVFLRPGSKIILKKIG